MDTEEDKANAAMTVMERPKSEYLDACLGIMFPVLDHGFIRVIDYMGNEAAIVQAARVSYGIGTKSIKDDIGLLRYLIRHRHTTPLEMCEIKLHVKLPIFVARQWIRHRTANVNEYSARYSILARDFYVPSGADLAPQSVTNKQGREGGYSDSDQWLLRQVIEDTSNRAFDAYDAMIDPDGGYALSRELARIVTPMNTYTEWYWKTDVHNLLHFLSLRSDPHAQKEIRVYAEVMVDLLKGWMPQVGLAWENYQRHAVTLSQQEALLLKAIIDGGGALWDADAVAAARSLSNRELAAFIETFGLEDFDWEDIRNER